MSKKNLAKRLIALVAIVAMFVAMTVTASAAEYKSVTTYVDSSDVKVTTYVTGLTAGDEVTYYAKGSEDVYVNQYTAGGETMIQSYVASASKVADMTITMAKVDKNFEDHGIINGGAADANGLTFGRYVDGERVVIATYEPGSALPAVGDMLTFDAPAMVQGEDGWYSASKVIVSYMKAVESGYQSCQVDTIVDYVLNTTGNKISVPNSTNLTWGDVEFDADGVATAKAMLGDTVIEYVDVDIEYVKVSETTVPFTSLGGIAKETSYTDDDGVEVTNGKYIASRYQVVLPEGATEVGVTVTAVNEGSTLELKDYPALGVVGSETPNFAVAFLSDDTTSVTFVPYYIVEGVKTVGIEKTVEIVK